MECSTRTLCALCALVAICFANLPVSAVVLSRYLLESEASPLSIPFTAAYANANSGFEWYLGLDSIITGKPGKVGFAVQITNFSTGASFSNWHDVPLDLTRSKDGSILVWQTAEIPRDETAKYETQTSEPGNPIQQDTDDVKAANGTVVGAKLRFYKYGGSRGNYGAIAQTWENSNVTDKRTGLIGDGDPVDAIDIGSARAPIGGIYRVKVLGCLGMIDKNETDWKIITVNTKDKNASVWRDIKDVPQATLRSVFDFFLNYKKAENKPQPLFLASDGTATATNNYAKYFFNASTCADVITHSHDEWVSLVCGRCKAKACSKLWYPPGRCPTPAAKATPAAG